jgi:hypothetical protein
MAECMAIELAELIERGLELISTRSRQPGGALRLALIGKSGDLSARPRSTEDAAKLLGISTALVRLVELNDKDGVAPIEIARALRLGSLGLSSGRVTAEPQCETSYFPAVSVAYR